MIPEGTKPEAVTKELAADVIDAVNAYKAGTSMSLSAIGKAVGYAGSVVSQVLASKYAGDWRQVIIDLDRWLDEQIKRDAAPKATEFVWTTVAQEIKTVADIAVQLSTIGLVYGPDTSGIGKTMALQAIRREKTNAMLITVDKVGASVTGVLESICRELKISAGHANRILFQKIVERLKGTPRLLMIDQIHNLCGAKDDKPLYCLADLYDATAAPQLWCGTSDIVAYLERGQAKGREPLAQIRRRIGIRRDLMQRTRERGDGGRGEPLYSIDEIRRVFAKNKIRLAPDGARYLQQIANRPDGGALGTCKNIVVIATTIAEVRGAAALTAEMLRAAHRELVNARTFDLVESEIESQQPTPALKVG